MAFQRTSQRLELLRDKLPAAGSGRSFLRHTGWETAHHARVGQRALTLTSAPLPPAPQACNLPRGTQPSSTVPALQKPGQVLGARRCCLRRAELGLAGKSVAGSPASLGSRADVIRRDASRLRYSAERAPASQPELGRASPRTAERRLRVLRAPPSAHFTDRAASPQMPTVHATGQQLVSYRGSTQ